MHHKKEYVFTAITRKNWEAVLAQDLNPILKHLLTHIQILQVDKKQSKLNFFICYLLKEAKAQYQRIELCGLRVASILERLELHGNITSIQNIEMVQVYLEDICLNIDALILELSVQKMAFPMLKEFLNIVREELSYFEKMRQEQAGKFFVDGVDLSKVYLKVPMSALCSPHSKKIQQEMYDFVFKKNDFQKENIFIDIKQTVREYFRENIGGKDFILLEYAVPDSNLSLTKRWHHNTHDSARLQMLMPYMKELMQIANFKGCWYVHKSGQHAIALDFHPFVKTCLTDKVEYGRKEDLRRFYSNL